MIPIFAEFSRVQLAQFFIDGLSFGLLIALIALGYTMVYGIIELINFAHGDLFMLGCCLAWTLLTWLVPAKPESWQSIFALAVCIVLVPTACALLNFGVDRVVYKPLRNAPKLAPFVSALGVSFVFMNFGLFWIGSQSVDFPALVQDAEQKTTEDETVETAPEGIRISRKDVMVFVVTIPLMLGLTYLVKFTKLGKAMRATAQNPTAAKLMGIDTDRVISATFLIGGALAGFGSIIFGLKVNSVHFQMGFQNGLYAFTAAVLGGIGNIPGAVLGAVLIGLIRSYGSAFVGEQWTGALIFATLIVLLVFRPQGLLGARVREKV